MTQIRKIRSGWKTGSDQHRISAAIDRDLWEWLKDQPNKNRTINQALYAMIEKEHEELKNAIELFNNKKGSWK